jgi:large subunit ribosomal protein L9e
MKPILAERSLSIPEGVTVDVKSRRIIVKGPRGTLQKDLSHICADIYLIEEEGEKKLKVDCHFRKRKELSALRTVISHVSNMIVGVTQGFRCFCYLTAFHAGFSRCTTDWH